MSSYLLLLFALLEFDFLAGRPFVLEVVQTLAPSPLHSGNCGGLANVLDRDQKLPFAQLGLGLLVL